MKTFFLNFIMASAMLMLTFNSEAQQAAKSKAPQAGKPEIEAVSATPVFTGTGADWFISIKDAPFPGLPYTFEALEPVIDKATVEIHYDRHHRAYFNNYKKAIETSPETGEMSFYKLFGSITEFPATFRNNAGGFYNHVLYWSNMSTNGGGKPSGRLMDAIVAKFGSYEEFVKQFENAAKTRFGSGWAWLSVDLATNELFISSTPNQDNPLMNTVERRGFPLLGIDVWEHAYYLKYQNKRPEYIQNFWNKLNWADVQARYEEYFTLVSRLK